MKEVSFRIPGKPAPQPRPRKGKHGNFYSNSPKSAEWKDLIRLFSKKYYQKPPWPGPVGMQLDFEMPIPKAVKDQHWVAKKPDIDNLAKAVMDALSGLIYEDDAQICALVVIKTYSETPGVNVHCYELQGV